MFTGLVIATGRLTASEPAPGGIRLWLEAPEVAPQTAIGDSVAVDGCCLTLVARDGAKLAFDAVPETLERTTLGARAPGDRVNLELPLRPADRMGGHFVQGHVDAVGRLLRREEAGVAVRFVFALPAALRGQVVEKGSIAVDGVSLTVADADAAEFSVALIPHTLAATTLGDRAVGDLVNLEGDILAKYVAARVGS